VALVAVPLVLPQFYLLLSVEILIMGLFAVGFNLLMGYAGMVSFGHAAFYGVGAYACGLLLKKAELALPLAFLAGPVAAALFAVVIGFFCIRLTRIYFSMLTLSFGMMIFSLAWKWRDMTGGDDGLVGIPRAPLEVPGLFKINMASMENYYYVVLAFSILAIFLFYRIIHSAFGLTLQGIRDSETRTSCVGISVRKYRLLSFTVAGLYAGLAGALLPPLESTVTPPVAHWSHSAEPVLATLLGGIYAFSGPIVGSALFYLLKDLIVRVTEYWLICLGTIVIILVMGFRGGVVSIFSPRGGRR